MLYTPAMLAELLHVPVTLVRAWQRRGWIVPCELDHKLPRFDFAEVTIARTLATLHAAGVSSRQLARRLEELQSLLPGVERPLAELSLVVEGRKLLVRREAGLLEPGGQWRFDFGALSEGEAPPILSSPALFLSRAGRDDPQSALPTELAHEAAEREEAGDLPGAAEMYRAALAAGGPRAELCFQLAETLYRLDELSAARERYYMALELDEDFVEARANLGCLLAELGENTLAIAALEGAIATHAGYADAHFHLARLLDDLDRGAEALPHWQAFLRLAPESPWGEEARERIQT